jgi:excisionase family DNA binding protein
MSAADRRLGYAQAANPPALYTAAEAAAILRVKPSWLERQAARRKVPFTMLGHSYRFTPDHLAAIVEMHETGPADTVAVTVSSASRRRGQQSLQRVSGPLRARPRDRGNVA